MAARVAQGVWLGVLPKHVIEADYGQRSQPDMA